MKITKFGHCCLLVEENGVRILTDPGIYSTQQNEIKNIDILYLEHLHQGLCYFGANELLTRFYNKVGEIETEKIWKMEGEELMMFWESHIDKVNSYQLSGNPSIPLSFFEKHIELILLF